MLRERLEQAERRRDRSEAMLKVANRTNRILDAELEYARNQAVDMKKTLEEATNDRVV